MNNQDGQIEIKLPRCTLAITEAELMTMLKAHPDTWERAIRRGKGLLRQYQAERRHASETPPAGRDVGRYGSERKSQ
jgi:hypothetical protein